MRKTPRMSAYEAERVTSYQMVIDIVQRFDEAYRAFHGRGSSLGSSLESYLRQFLLSEPNFLHECPEPLGKGRMDVYGALQHGVREPRRHHGH